MRRRTLPKVFAKAKELPLVLSTLRHPPVLARESVRRPVEGCLRTPEHGSASLKNAALFKTELLRDMRQTGSSRPRPLPF
jgi:hypothetical protein